MRPQIQWFPAPLEGSQPSIRRQGRVQMAPMIKHLAQFHAATIRPGPQVGFSHDQATKGVGDPSGPSDDSHLRRSLGAGLAGGPNQAPLLLGEINKMGRGSNLPQAGNSADWDWGLIRFSRHGASLLIIWAWGSRLGRKPHLTPTPNFQTLIPYPNTFTAPSTYSM